MATKISTREISVEDSPPVKTQLSNGSTFGTSFDNSEMDEQNEKAEQGIQIIFIFIY
jgi:hypothetical protein